MYYGAVWSRREVLTRDDLKHTVLLHVGGKVPSPHVLLHYANVGQLLTGGGKKKQSRRKFVAQQWRREGQILFFKTTHKTSENRVLFLYI